MLQSEIVQIRSGEQVVGARQIVRSRAADLGFSLVDQTRIVTAASELARNALQHGKGGTMKLETLNSGNRRGLRLTFEDQGPGIADIELAMKDGYSTVGGLGLGLSGSKRLMNEFSISSSPGNGTCVMVTKWK